MKSSASLLTSLIRYIPPYVCSRSSSIPTCTLASFPGGLGMRLTLIPASTHILTQLHCYYHYLMQAYTHTSTSIIPYSGKLSEEKTFANLMFCSTKFGGMTLFGDTCGQFMTVFSMKILFSTNLRKFPTIQYLSLTVILFLHTGVHQGLHIPPTPETGSQQTEPFSSTVFSPQIATGHDSVLCLFINHL